MGLFNNLFKGRSEGENSVKINWIALTESSQIEEIISQSNTKFVLIFKHSTRCGVSSMALRSFEREYDLPEEAIDLYFLDLLKFRAISNEISVRFNVQHKSPQVLVLKKEQVVYHDSHYHISVDAVKELFAK